MNWNKSYNCPIDQEDQNWIINMLQWINDEMFDLTTKEVILPTKQYFDHNFTGDISDAQYVLDSVGKYFDTDTSPIKLDFYSEEPLEIDRGLVTKKEKGTGSAAIYTQLDLSLIHI